MSPYSHCTTQESTERPVKKQRVASTPDPSVDLQLDSLPEGATSENRTAAPPPRRKKRKYVPTHLVKHELNASLRFDRRLLSATGTGGGYVTALASRGASVGTYFYEVKITAMQPPQPSAHVVEAPSVSSRRRGDASNYADAVRVGFATKDFNLQTPMGVDHLSYSVRSRLGSKFHRRVGRRYMPEDEDGFKNGDVIGCLIHLPREGNVLAEAAASAAAAQPDAGKAASWTHKSASLKPVLGAVVPAAATIARVVPGSFIAFYKNGRPLGTAYRDVFSGEYFPGVSIYKSAQVRFNFGPDYDFPPPATIPVEHITANQGTAAPPPAVDAQPVQWQSYNNPPPPEQPEPAT